MQMIDASLYKINADGFALRTAVVPAEQLSSLLSQIEPLRGRSESEAGMRLLLQRSETVRNLAHCHLIMSIAQSALAASSCSCTCSSSTGSSPPARPVRAILFDKTPNSNWYVTWHQDVTIAVKERREVAGYGPWSIKSGVQHVQPPAAVLEHMVTLRIHIDDSPMENGPIHFIPGSHKLGILDAQSIAELRAQRKAVACPAARGDIILMRPMILHSSPVSSNPDHRRVLHIEYAAYTLPGGLQWTEA